MLLKTLRRHEQQTQVENRKSCKKRRYQRERAVGVCGWWVGAAYGDGDSAGGVEVRRRWMKGAAAWSAATADTPPPPPQ